MPSRRAFPSVSSGAWNRESVVGSRCRLCYGECEADHPAKRVTRDVEPSHVRDLLELPPHAALAFTAGGAIELTPVLARFVDGRYQVAVPIDATPSVAEGTEVVLLIDDGAYWFELRGISVRGRLVPVDPPAGSTTHNATWCEVAPARTLAWDYGTIHEE